MKKEKSAQQDGMLDGYRYESIANEIIEVMYKHNAEFYEVLTILDLVKLKCQYQNLGKSLV